VKNQNNTDYDCDWLVVGSGFGGSVCALRLAEKGYSVQVLECGKRYEDDQLMKSSWNYRKFLWAPLIKFFGIVRLNLFKHVAILSGSAVGGGSIAYAATLYRAADPFYKNPQWAGLADDWKAELAPHYDTAERMLGVTEPPFESVADQALKRVAGYLGCEGTFQKTRVGLYFGTEQGAKPGEKVPDPYFGGEGPERTACIRCGACMQGCPFGAKNTLLKNYLWFAEKRGVEIHELTTVIDIKPIDEQDGASGYVVTTERSGAWFFKQRRRFRARAVAINAGALNSNRLLARCKLNGSLPNISDRLGKKVRTNSETLVALTYPKGVDFTNCVSISSSIFPDADTHIEMVHPGKWGGGWKLMFTLLTPQAPLIFKPFLFLFSAVRHPCWLMRALWPFAWIKRSIITGVMQSSDNAIGFRFRKGWFGGVVMQTEQDAIAPMPMHFPVLDKMFGMLLKKEDVIPQGMVFESLLARPVTAHILGGAVISNDAGSGVVDSQLRVHHYENLMICDGSVFPANPGVNPSLTITALAERAMSLLPAKSESACCLNIGGSSLTTGFCR